MNIEIINNFPDFQSIDYAAKCINSLPDELLVSIFSQLNQKDMCSVTQVNRTFHRVATAQTEQESLASVRKFVQTLVFNLDPARHAEAILRLNAVGKVGIQTVLKSKYEEQIKSSLEGIKEILQTLLPAEELDYLFSRLDPRQRIHFSDIVLLSKKTMDLTIELKHSVSNSQKSAQWETIQNLLQAGAIPTPEVLVHTVLHGELAWLELFLQSGAIPSQEILSNAIYNGKSDMVRLLLQHGTIPQEKDWLRVLISNQGIGALKVLVERGFKCPLSMLELCMVSMTNEQLDLILSSGMLPSTQVLNQAIRYGHPFCTIQKIVSLGVQANTDSLRLAMLRNELWDILHLLLKAGAVPDSDSLRSLMYRGGSLEIIRAFILAGMRPETRHLKTAVWEKYRFEVIELLVESGAKPDHEVLEYARAANSSPEVMEYLEGVMNRQTS